MCAERLEHRESRASTSEQLEEREAIVDSKSIDFAAVPGTAIRVLTSPASFFREMPKSGGYVEPLVFMAAMGVVGGVIQAVIALLHLHAVAAAGMGVSAIVVVPIAVAIFGFVGAAVLFAIWKVMGSQESYETAYRCGAYISAVTPITTLLGILPYAGIVVALAITTYYLVVASVEVHKLPAQKAWMVFGIIGALLALSNVGAQFAARKAASRFEENAKVLQQQGEEMRKSADELKKQLERMGKGR